MWCQIVLLVAAALIGVAHSSYECYVCDSDISPLTCGQSLFVSMFTQTKADCTCCSKKNSNGVVYRNCEKSAVPMDCVPLPGINAVCLGDMCNAATPTQHRVTWIALSVVVMCITYVFTDN